MCPDRAPAPVAGRVAVPEDTAAITETLALAFYEDPVWSWAFSDPERRLEQYRAVWRLIVESAIDGGWGWLTPGAGAAALWILPGRPELRPEDEEGMGRRLEELLGEGAERVLDTMQRFDAAHPQEPEHYYLSLLGTHPDRRGRGEGMSLLAESLTRLDAEGAPAYLESSNPANEPRYERLGFETRGEFELGEDGPNVMRMWREPR
ncbi:MAG TPA: GNAT family N-acetyltransferase [Solirubrobacterales bacterium]